MFKTKTLYIFIFLLIPVLMLSGWVEQRNFTINHEIIWSPENISWLNFTEVDKLSNDYVATIYSEIYCPEEIPESDFKIFAYMNPSLSNKLHDSMLSDYTLLHEQYHFNITEYYARLLRRDIIKIGKRNLTAEVYDSLFITHDLEKDIMQWNYDSITDHSVNQEDQRYWELKIDDLMRETAYFQDNNLNNYYLFEADETNYYRHVYITMNRDLLFSYPIKEIESKKGEAYQVFENNDETIIHFYKNGELFNGGKFETAITSIKKSDSLTEIRYYNPDETLNSSLPNCIFKIYNEPNKKVNAYFNNKEERVSRNGIYQTDNIKTSENTYETTYYNKDLSSIKDESGAIKKKRTLDSFGRTIKIEFLTLNNTRTKDNYFVSQIVKEYTDLHRTSAYKEYNEDGTFAKHLYSYNLKYEYDEQGNLKSSINLNDLSEIAPNNDGVSIYNYTYDLMGNETSIKSFNKNGKPTRGLDDFFMLVRKYDDNNRITYYGQFYSDYVLAFDNEKWGALQYSYPNDSITIIKNVDVFGSVFNNDNGIAINKEYRNKNGQLERLIYFDYKNDFAITSDGVIEFRNKYDERGNKIENSTYDSLGNLKAFDHDVALVKWSYDTNNNKTKTTYFNTDLELANANQNITYNVFEYNAKNQIVERRNYNKSMEPALFNGYFKSKIIPNIMGKDSITYDFGVDDKLLSGVCKYVYVYNQYGNMTLESYFDKNSRPLKNTDGVAGIRHHYNAKQEYVGYTYLDESGNKTNNINGVAYNLQEMSEMSFIISDSYYDKYDKPVIGPDDYHRQELSRDECGEVIRSKKIGLRNQLIPDEYGVAEYVYSLNKTGIINTIKRYDTNGNLTNNIYGIAETYYTPYLNGLYYVDYELDYLGNNLTNDEENEETEEAYE